MRKLKERRLLEIIIIYLVVTIYLSVKNVVIYKNIINPIFWGIIFIFLIWKIRNGFVRIKIRKKYYIYIIVILCFNIISYLYLGFNFGFSRNPYSHEAISILKNIFVQIVPIIGIEITRIVIGLKNKDNKIILIFLTILLILLEINYNAINNNFLNREEFFKYVCSTIIPLITYNILYMYLVVKDSYWFTLSYRLIGSLVVLLSPFVPNIDWFVIGSFNILSSVIIYLFFNYKLVKEKNYLKNNREESKVMYFITIIISISIVCFMLGVFEYQPISIMSNSMFPLYKRGDVVIFRKLKDDELDEIPKGAIIIYSVGDKNIVHRIVNVVKANNKVLYETQGDNNNSPDMDLVNTYQIIGIYVFHIKYIGFPSIWLYDYFNLK